MSNAEKEIYTLKANHLLTHIRTGVNSFLDIGAGDPFWGTFLVKHVNHYVAIESDPDRAFTIKQAGFNVLEGDFPHIKISETFDIVLVSQAMPKDMADYENFLKSAWNYVSKGEKLIVVTFAENQEKLKEIIRIISMFGNIEVEQIVSDVLNMSQDLIDHTSNLRCISVRKEL